MKEPITFEDMAQEEVKLFNTKNMAYTKGGDEWGNFRRRAKILSLYPKLDLSKPEIVALVDMTKQLDAALWQTSEGYEDKIEGVDKRLQDAGIYIKIARLLRKAK